MMNVFHVVSIRTFVVVKCAGTRDCFRNAHNQNLSSIRCLAQNSRMIVVSDNPSVVCCRLVRFVNKMRGLNRREQSRIEVDTI